MCLLACFFAGENVIDGVNVIDGDLGQVIKVTLLENPCLHACFLAGANVIDGANFISVCVHACILACWRECHRWSSG